MGIIGERNRPGGLINSGSEEYIVTNAVPQGKMMRGCGQKKPRTGYDEL